MAVLGVDDFKSKLRGGGARANLFKITLNFPFYAGGDVELTSFMCKGGAMPASIIAPIEIPFRGRQLKIAGDRTFDPWTVTIFNDTGFEVRDAMERWMNGINSHSANVGITNPIAYQADLLCDQLDKNGTILKRYVIRGAFPTNVSEIELSYDANDAIEEFTVEFQVQYWEARTTG